MSRVKEEKGSKMVGRLLYRDADGRDAAVDLSPDGSFLGRAADCAVRTDDAMVSRKNCKIWLSSGHWQLEDLGSSNGTYVNEVRVARQRLNHADVVRCGTLQVRFVEVERVEARREDVSSVQVDRSLTSDKELAGLKGQLEGALAERDALATKLRSLGEELEQTRARSEADGSELQKLRIEVVGLREKSNELGRTKAQQEDELNAQTRVAEQLRRELDALTKSHAEVKRSADHLAEELAARDRQLDRSHEDVQRTKLGLDELRQKLAELEKTKDAGWKELNSRVGELDNLRAVIAEQERLLEERRVGLMALEASVQELRAEKEKLLRDLVTARSERDESRESATRSKHHIEALEEEHRRLARMLSSRDPGAPGDGEERGKLADDLRDAKVELKTVRSETLRLKDRIDRADSERIEIEGKMARLDVERAQAFEERQRSESARARADEARARAEAARQKSEEEKQTAVFARDAALTSAEQIRRGAVEDKSRADELEAKLGEVQKKSAAARALATGGHEITDEVRIRELEEELAKVGTELALAQAQVAAQVADAHGHPANGVVAELRRRTEAAYVGINDAISELRTNILVAKDLVAEHGQAVPDAEVARALAEAISVSVDRTEDAKGLLRSLREVIEG